VLVWLKITKLRGRNPDLDLSGPSKSGTIVLVIHLNVQLKLMVIIRVQH